LGNISTYASNTILNFLLGRQETVVPSCFYCALSTEPIGTNGDGLKEPDDPAYKRLKVPNDEITFSLANNKIVTIISDLVFEESSVAWGKVTHYVFFDNLQNIWFYGELEVSRDIEIYSSLVLDRNYTKFKFDICGGSTQDMSINTPVANKILNHFLRQSPPLTLPEYYYLGVSSTPIDISGYGYTEPPAIEYKRVVIPNDKNSFTIAKNKSLTLKKSFSFSTANVDWGVMTHYFISDSPTGGDIWWRGVLDFSRNVEIATTLLVKPEGFKWILDSCYDRTDLQPALPYWG